jgi:hypothetical protein
MRRGARFVYMLIFANGLALAAPPADDFSDLASKHSVEESLAARSTAADPCMLLEAREAETALGAALAVPPFRAIEHGASGQGTPDADGMSCRYESANFQHIDVQMLRSGGAQLLQQLGMAKAKLDTHAKGMVALADGTMLTGLWDEARIVGCCELIVLVGDSSILIDVTGAQATLGVAGKLADKAIPRLDHPLSIDGRAGIAAARSRDLKRPVPRSTCSAFAHDNLVTVFGASVTTQPADKDACRITYMQGNQKRELALRILWRDGNWQFRQDRATFAMLGAAAGAHETADVAHAISAGLAATDEAGSAWEQAASSQIKFAAVKNDALIEALVPPASELDKVRALISQTMAHW